MKNFCVVFSLFLLAIGANGQNLSALVLTLSAEVDSELKITTPTIKLKLSEEGEARLAFSNLKNLLPLELLQTENVNKILLSIRTLPSILNGTEEGNCFKDFYFASIANYVEQQIRFRFDTCGKKYFSSKPAGDKYLTDIINLANGTKNIAADCEKNLRTNPRLGKLCIDRTKQLFLRNLTSLREAFSKEYEVNYVEEITFCIEESATRAENLINDISSILTDCIVLVNPTGKVSSELQTYFPFVTLSGVTNQLPWTNQDLFITDVENLEASSIIANTTVTNALAGKLLTFELAKQKVSISVNKSKNFLSAESERLGQVAQNCVLNFQDAISRNTNISANALLTCVKNIQQNPSLDFTNTVIDEFTQWKFSKSMTRLQCVSLVESVVTRDGIIKCIKEIEEDDKLFIEYVKNTLEHLTQDAAVLERQINNCNIFSTINVKRQLEKDTAVFESCVTKAIGKKYTFTFPA